VLTRGARQRETVERARGDAPDPWQARPPRAQYESHASFRGVTILDHPMIVGGCSSAPIIVVFAARRRVSDPLNWM